MVNAFSLKYFLLKYRYTYIKSAFCDNEILISTMKQYLHGLAHIINSVTSLFVCLQKQRLSRVLLRMLTIAKIFKSCLLLLSIG